MNISATVHRAADCDHAADHRIAAGRRGGLHAAAGVAAAAGGFPVHLGGASLARRKSGDDGIGGGNAAGAAVRTHRRRQPDDLVSQLGSTGITLQFDLNRNIDAAARDVQAAINAARSHLPANLPSNPTYRKVNPADAPVLILALTSDAMTQDQMYDAADSDPGAETVAGRGRWPGLCGRSVAACRAH